MPTKKLNTRGSATQDLAAAKEELKQFRRDVAILKKKGLLDKKYDARSVKPTKYLKGVLREFNDVLKGAATPVKVSKEKAAYYKSRGYKTKNGRVVVPHLPNEKVIGTHGNFVRSITGRGGKITVIDLGLNKDDILQWQDDLRNNRFKLRENEQLRFQLFGHNSHMGFSSTRLKTAQERMAEYLENYDIVTDAEKGKLNADDNREIVEGMVIFKVTRDPDSGNWPKPDSRADEYEINEEIRERKNRRAAERTRARLGRMTEREFNAYLDERAERAKTHRNNMTDAQRERANQLAKERMRKMRSKKKQK